MKQKKIMNKGKTQRDSSKRSGEGNYRSETSAENNLKKQYNLIREDIVKLRNDLQKGYDMAKEVMEKRNILGQILKSK